MDEHEFRRTLRSLSERPCIFEKSVLSRHAACACARKYNIAEREAVHCTSASACGECAALLKALRERAGFALGVTAASGALPHAKALRLQVGGLRGLRSVLHKTPANDEPIADVHALLRQLREEFDGPQELPYEQIMRRIAAFSGRRRARGRSP